MKKLLYSAVIVVAMVVAFASCDKDKNKDSEGLTITAKVEKGSEYTDIKRVRVVETTKYEGTLASSAYTNGGFSFTLSETVADEYLALFDPEDMIGLTVSDMNVKTGSVDIEAYSSASGDFEEADYLDDFICGKYEHEETSTSLYEAGIVTMYTYADRAATITGTVIDSTSMEEFNIEESYNASLKKGWNTIYVTEELRAGLVGGEIVITAKMIFSTTPVSGLKWYFGAIEGKPVTALTPAKKTMKNALKDAKKISRLNNPFFKTKK